MSELGALLYRTAVSHGATVRKARVSSYDSDKLGRPLVKLDSGTILTADVVIGTDPSDEVTRALVYDDEEIDDDYYHGLTLFKYVPQYRSFPRAKSKLLSVEAPQSALRDRSLLDEEVRSTTVCATNQS